MSNPDTTRNERQRRWYWRHREHKLELTKKRYHDNKANGICVMCGSVDAKPGIVRCEECAEKARRSKNGQHD